jgi:hypothetical protein
MRVTCTCVRGRADSLAVTHTGIDRPQSIAGGDNVAAVGTLTQRLAPATALSQNLFPDSGPIHTTTDRLTIVEEFLIVRAIQAEPALDTITHILYKASSAT